MEPIELHSVLTFAFCIGILIMLFFILVFYIKEWSKRRDILEAEYIKLYSKIQKHIETYPVNLSNYYVIKREIVRLENLKWKNKEKTVVICMKFCSGRFLNIALSEQKKRYS